MSKWTDEQRLAIDAEGCSVIVSAAAGSGKTSVLVERLIRIISDDKKQVPVERMIVVTFTNDAAAEMKQRLSAALSQKIDGDPENQWLARQNAMLGNAAISTISSFCIDLLRKNVCQLPFSSGFRVAEETEEDVLKTEAYKIVSDSFYRERYDDMIKLRNNFCGTNDYQLERLIYELYGCISSAPFFGLWLDNAKEKYEKGDYKREYLSIVKSDIDKCADILEKAEKSADSLNQPNVAELVSSERKQFENALKKISADDYSGFYDSISGISFAVFPRAKKADDTEERKRVKAYRDSYKKQILDIRDKLSAYCEFDSDKALTVEILRIMSDFLMQFDRELSEIKSRKNIIGFDDAERLVLKLLADVKENGKIEKTALAEELSAYYELIMIDEFQDSNNRQDMIFRLLSRGGTADEYGSNLFFVGDVKQSIYRFRLANPDNFINAVKNSVPYENGNKKMSYIRLSRNFRSSKEVIDISNYIFSCIMSQKCGDIDYNEDEYLREGASFPAADRRPVIMLYDKSDKQAENAEAKIIARKISEMLSEGVTVKRDGFDEPQPCEMRDFCILMRGNREAQAFADELSKLGISAQGGTNTGYLRSREISVLISLLRVIDNPLADTPLMSVMLSPMFMFTPDEAAEVRLVSESGSLYMNIVKGIGLKNTADDEQDGQEYENPLFEGVLLEKARALYSIINELRLYVSAYTLRELVRKIYDRTDFMSVIQLYGDGERKKANLRMMLEYVGSYEKNNDGGLPGFIRYIDRIMDSKSDLGAAPDIRGVQNAVSIKTMHRSKGLEYPFVFIAGTDKEFNREDQKKAFQFSFDKGLGIKIQDPAGFRRYKTIPYELIGICNRQSSVSEEMRLLYVAMTRAKERLFITIGCDEKTAEKAGKYAEIIYNDKGITPELAASAGSMADWLMMCMTAHSKSAALREKLGIYESFRYDIDFEVEYTDCGKYVSNDAEEEIKETSSEREPADDEKVRRLEEMFAFDYDLSLSALTSKLSVSDMAKDDSDSYMVLRRPEFSGDAKELTAAEKGTALHKFFQFAKFECLEKSIADELERLFDEGYLSRKQKESVKESDVKAFMKSKLYERITKAKKVYREKKFLIAIDDLELSNDYGREYRSTSGMLNGIIDMVLEFEDYLVLVDYKTDRVSDIRELEERYSAQLELYRKALAKTESKPVKETLIYSFYKKDELSLTEVNF